MANEENRDVFKEKYLQTYPGARKGSIAMGAGIKILWNCRDGI